MYEHLFLFLSQLYFLHIYKSCDFFKEIRSLRDTKLNIMYLGYRIIECYKLISIIKKGY